MIELLKVIGIIMAVYGCYGAFAGRVYSSRDSRYFIRHDEPFSFWSVSLGYVIVGCLIYFGLVHKYG
jgi:hypothetical protein